MGCDSCKFYNFTETVKMYVNSVLTEVKKGTCHFHNPVALQPGGLRTSFPTVFSTDWCKNFVEGTNDSYDVCSTCKYYETTSAGVTMSKKNCTGCLDKDTTESSTVVDQGVCRVCAPYSLHGNILASNFPRVDGLDWCGHYERYSE